MTFARFEELVKEKYPKAKLYKYQEFSNNEISVGIIFDGTNQGYRYCGTYFKVLNELEIKTIHKQNYEYLINALEKSLIELKSTNGIEIEDEFFNGQINNSRQIERLTNELNDIRTNYVIV